jgi:lysophospholipase L1-like esterase
LDLKPDLLSILVGVNDTASVVFNREPVISAEKYEELYQSLLDQTLEKFPAMVLVLCEPFILPVGKVKDNLEAYKPEIEKRQAIVRRLADKNNAVFVGFQEVFDHACKKAADHYWMWDGVHPTVAGHELMAREWLKQVGKRVSF